MIEKRLGIRVTVDEDWNEEDGVCLRIEAWDYTINLTETLYLPRNSSAYDIHDVFAAHARDYKDDPMETTFDDEFHKELIDLCHYVSKNVPGLDGLASEN
jgi:hypothetical protein